MKSLLFILLLDYSGSMDQVLKDKPKIQQLKTEVGALMSTGQPNAPAYAVVFGTEPKKKCQDVRILRGTNAGVSATLQTLKPGNQGRTPLSESLKQTVRIALQSDFHQVVVVTDGADSCGQNPCEALVKADQELGRAKKKLAMHVVGFDLKNEKGLECLKKLKLSNIALAISEAGNSADLGDLLKRSQIEGLNESDMALSDKDRAIKGLKRAKLNGPNADGKARDGDKKKTQSKTNEPALLEIVGAPPEASFLATGEKASRTWKGSYLISFTPGRYSIRYLDPNGTALSLDLPGGVHTRVPWARLFKVSTATLKLKNNYLGLKWRPTEKTHLIHGEVSEFETAADLNRKETEFPGVPLGEWEVEVISPPWLKGGIKTKKIGVGPGEGHTEVEQAFEDQVVWITNPNPSQPSVLNVFAPNTPGERHLIPPGQSRLPILKTMKYKWFTP